MDTLTYDTDSTLAVIMNLGKEMLMCGAEVNRVENAVTRLCTAYGFTRADIFTITSLLLVTVRDKDDQSCTQSRHVASYVFNFYRLEELNALSRKVCAQTPSPEEFQKMLDDIIMNSHFSKLLRFIGFVLTSFGFCLLFKGSFFDALISCIISMLIFAVDRFFHHFRLNAIMFNLVSSFIAGICAFSACAISPVLHVDKIMIGDIMLLIPGLVLTNAIKDMIGGDIIAGFLRFCEAILTAIAIALGFWLSMVIVGVVK